MVRGKFFDWEFALSLLHNDGIEIASSSDAALCLPNPESRAAYNRFNKIFTAAKMEFYHVTYVRIRCS
jgi:hypothetical protein